MNTMNKKYVPVMLMPFQEDKTIDYAILEELIEFYLGAGAGGLFANCLSSEMFNLTQEEMLESVSFVVEKVDGRVPVVATGTFPGTVENQAEFVKEIYATGVNSVIVITGLLAEETDSEAVFKANVNKLLSLTDDVPLGFYECPVPYKRIISPELLTELVETGRVMYHKDTCLDIDSVKRKNQGTRSFHEFGLYDAYMVHAVESLKSGSAGLSCIQGNYFPELVVWLCDHYSEDSAEVKEVQEFFARHMDIMHDTYPASAKYVLHQRGLKISEVCRNGSVTDERKALDELLREFETLAATLQLSQV